VRRAALPVFLAVVAISFPSAADPLSWEALRTLASSAASDDDVLAEIASRSLGFVLQTRQVIELRSLGRGTAFLSRLVAVERTNPVARTGPTQPDESDAPMPTPPGSSVDPRPHLDPSSCDSAGSTGTPPADLESIALELDLADPFLPDGGRHRLAAAAGFLRLGLPSAACITLGPLLDVGTVDPDYACALLILSGVRSAFDCPLPDPVALARRDATTLPANAASAHAYLVGLDLLRSGRDPTSSEALLRGVEAQAPEYPFAVYQLAMIDLGRRHYRAASKALLATADIDRAREDAVSIADLSLLALGAIATENGLFAEAIETYRRIPPVSRAWAEATRGRAYAGLKSGDHADALGAVLVLKRGLRTVPWVDFPEIDLIEAMILVQACHMDEARGVATTSLARVRARLAALAALPDPTVCDAACRAAAHLDPNKAVGSATTAAPAVLGDAGVRRHARALVESQRERTVLDGPGREFSALASVRDRIGEESALRQASLEEAILLAAATDRADTIRLENDLVQFLVDLDAVRIDVLTFQMRELTETRGLSFHRQLLEGACARARRGLRGDDQIAWILSRGNVVLEEPDLRRLRECGVPWLVLDYLRSSAIKPPATRSAVDPAGRDHRLVWDFDGEFWRDEMKDIRVELPDRCGTGLSPPR
jgi:tetratricopeptide (TPR) repeat protein